MKLETRDLLEFVNTESPSTLEGTVFVSRRAGFSPWKGFEGAEITGTMVAHSNKKNDNHILKQIAVVKIVTGTALAYILGQGSMLMEL